MNNLKSKLTSRPVLLLIFVLFVVGALLVIVKFLLPSADQPGTSQTPSVPLEQKEVLLAFSPNTVTASSSGGKVNADITIDAGDAAVSYIKVDVSFDPKIFSNVTITPFKDPTSPLSYSMIAGVDTTNASKGSIVATYTLINGAEAQKGKAILAKFSATYRGNEEATVTIFPDSTVATKESSYTIHVGRVNLDVFPR